MPLEGDHIIQGTNQVLLRLVQLNDRQQVRLGPQFILRAELVFEAGLGGDQMHPIGPRRAERDACGQAAVGQRHQGDGTGGLAAVEAQLAAFHGLVGGDFQFHLGAFQRAEPARILFHRLGGNRRIRRVLIDFFKGDLVGAGDGGQGVAAGTGIAGLHAVADAFAGDLDGGGKAVVAKREHGRHLAPFG